MLTAACFRGTPPDPPPPELEAYRIQVEDDLATFEVDLTGPEADARAFASIIAASWKARSVRVFAAFAGRDDLILRMGVAGS